MCHEPQHHYRATTESRARFHGVVWLLCRDTATVGSSTLPTPCEQDKGNGKDTDPQGLQAVADSCTKYRLRRLVESYDIGFHLLGKPAHPQVPQTPDSLKHTFFLHLLCSGSTRTATRGTPEAHSFKLKRTLNSKTIWRMVAKTLKPSPPKKK